MISKRYLLLPHSSRFIFLGQGPLATSLLRKTFGFQALDSLLHKGYRFFMRYYE